MTTYHATNSHILHANYLVDQSKVFHCKQHDQQLTTWKTNVLQNKKMKYYTTIKWNKNHLSKKKLKMEVKN